MDSDSQTESSRRIVSIIVRLHDLLTEADRLQPVVRDDVVALEIVDEGVRPPAATVVVPQQVKVRCVIRLLASARVIGRRKEHFTREEDVGSRNKGAD